MIIKNTGFDVNAASASYASRRLDTTDAARRKTDSSSFAETRDKTNHSNMDRIEISQRPLKGQTSLADAKKQILKDLQEDTDPSRIATLKSQIGAGQYRISASELAQSLTSINK